MSWYVYFFLLEFFRAHPHASIERILWIIPLEQYSCAMWCALMNPVESQNRFNTSHRSLVVVNGAHFTHLIQTSEANSLDQMCNTSPFTSTSY